MTIARHATRMAGYHHHEGWWGGAVLCSVLLHIGVWFWFPPIPVGRTPEWTAETRIRPFVMQEVRTAVPETRARPSADPVTPAVETIDAERFDALWTEMGLDVPVEWDAELVGEEHALAVPDVAELEVAWDARQSILAIRERLVPDERSALPRRLIPDTPRVPQALDLTAAVESADRQLLGTGVVGGTGRTAGPRRPPPESDPVPTTDPPEWATLEVLPEDDVVEAEPLDELLQITLQTYVPTDAEPYRYFSARIQRAPGAPLPVLAKDVILIQDASASMTQRTVERARAGLHYWLGSLNPGDRFDVWAFNDEVRQAFGGLTPVDARSRARGAYFVEQLRAEGKSDVFASLLPLLTERADSARPLLAVLTSDGIPTTGVLDSTAIIDRFAQENAGRVSVFTVGGGPHINDYLLDLLAYMNRGDSIITAQREELPASMEELARALSQPVLLDLRYRWPGEVPVESYPQQLTHLYLNRPLVVYGRVPLDRTEAILQVVGRAEAGAQDMLFQLDLESADRGDAAIREDWAWRKVYDLISQYIRTGENSWLDEIEALAEQHGLYMLFGTEFLPRELRQRFRFHGQRRDP